MSPISRDLFFCSTGRQVCLAIATMMTSGRAGALVFIEEDMAVPSGLQALIETLHPSSTLHVTTDAAEVEQFATFARWVPAVIRRNLSWSNGRLRRPHNWQPVDLTGQRFATAYMGHSGFFLSKSLAPLCQRVVLRESGLNNYIEHKVPLAKGLMRLMFGRPARTQVWGEEKWIDEIQVSRPENLPQSVRTKGSQLTLQAAMKSLTLSQREALFACFLKDGEQLPDLSMDRSALLVAQPLQEVGMDDLSRRQALYQGLADVLRQNGYSVFLKPHPRDPDLTLDGAITTLPPSLPIEMWAQCERPAFDIAVGLRSASLEWGDETIARQALQLANMGEFSRARYPDWTVGLNTRLNRLLSTAN